MRIKCCLFAMFIFSISANMVYAQQWAKTYGGTNYDRGNSIQQTSDGGYVVAGKTGSFGAGGEDAWVLKLNGDGTVAWQRTYGGNGNEWANSIQQTSDGGYIITGWTDSFGAGGEDVWVLKLNGDGTVAWQKTYGGLQNDRGNYIRQTADSGYIMAGWTDSFGAGGEDAWVLKLNWDGTVAWQKTYGGAGIDWSSSIQPTSDGGYIVAGATDSFGIAGEDIWVLKLNGDGTVAWQKTYGGAGTDWGSSIQQTLDGGYIVAGVTDTFGAGDEDAWILKLNADGTVAWQKTYGGPNADAVSIIKQTSDGKYILVGWTDSFAAGFNDAWVLKLNGDGTVAWQKTYGGPGYDRGISIQQTSNGGYVVTGGTWSFGSGSSDLFVLTLDANGEFIGCSAMRTSNTIENISTAMVNNTGAMILNTNITGNNTGVTITTSTSSATDACYNSTVNSTGLVNISTRALVQSGDDVKVAGFWIGGNTPKTVLIRARGPSMSGIPFNMPGVLGNPYLKLYAGSTVIAQNDDWRATDPLCATSGYICGGAADISATGLDPCQPNAGLTMPPPGCSQESAILVTLPPGGYTTIVSGVGGATGVGLVEVYEVNSVASKLVNISTRALVETGDDVMIGGFWIGGTTSKTVLIRARGPSMSSAPFNVPGTLVNPVMQLYHGSNLIAQNDNWQINDPLCGASGYICGGTTEIMATGLDPCRPNPGQTTVPPGCTQESAILITLPPGGYTAIVSGVGGTTGVGLVEVFQVN